MVLFRTSFDRLVTVGFIVRESNGTYNYSVAKVKPKHTGSTFDPGCLHWRIADLPVVSDCWLNKPTFYENTGNNRRDGTRNDN